jgi:alkanesulfonate monooxygenase SsuD/methylene tetrahydromethanopterin reductase-like flavin-dependent oxidoreductase (luciferase family)
MVSVTIICADTNDRADELAQPYEVLISDALAGQKFPLVTANEAAEHAFTERERTVIAALNAGQVRGDAERTRRGLAELIDRFSPDELIAAVPVYEIEDRIRALEIIAGR